MVMVRKDELLPHSAQRKDSSYRMAEECYKICLKEIPPAPPADPPRGMDCISGTTFWIFTEIETSAQWTMRNHMKIEIEEDSQWKTTSKYPTSSIIDPEYSTFSMSASDVM